MSQGKSNPAKGAKPSGPSSARPSADAGSFTLGPWWRRGISLLLIAHLILVIAVPLTIMRPSSRLAEVVVRWTRPWLDMTQLSHGYGFFADEPGPSHLVEFRFPSSAGGAPEIEQIPNLKKQWPRLRYHRHFMLSEKLMMYYAPKQPPPRPQDPGAQTQTAWSPERWEQEMRQWERDVENWRKRREMFEALVQSYGQHLLAATGKNEVEVELVEHALPSPQQVAAGQGLNVASSYYFIPESLERVTADMPPAASTPPPEEVAAPGRRERSISIPGERQ